MADGHVPFQSRWRQLNINQGQVSVEDGIQWRTVSSAIIMK